MELPEIVLNILVYEAVAPAQRDTEVVSGAQGQNGDGNLFPLGNLLFNVVNDWADGAVAARHQYLHF